MRGGGKSVERAPKRARPAPTFSREQRPLLQARFARARADPLARRARENVRKRETRRSHETRSAPLARESLAGPASHSTYRPQRATTVASRARVAPESPVG